MRCRRSVGAPKSMSGGCPLPHRRPTGRAVLGALVTSPRRPSSGTGRRQAPWGWCGVFSCQGTVPLGWRLAPPFHPRGGGGNPRPPVEPDPSGESSRRSDSTRSVYEGQPLRADSLIDRSGPPYRGIRPKRPVPHGLIGAAPDRPQCPQIDEQGGSRYTGRKRGVDAGDGRIGASGAESSERLFKRSVIDVHPEMGRGCGG